MRRPTKVDTSTEPDMLPFRRISCLRNGKAAAGGSSGTVTVYDCRMLGMLLTDWIGWCRLSEASIASLCGYGLDGSMLLLLQSRG